jgi:hypothetical protein
MARILLANDIDCAAPTNNFAVLAARFNGSPNFHGICLMLVGLSQADLYAFIVVI